MKNVDLHLLLPDLESIGQEQLQLYCNDWLQRPIAKEFGVSFLSVQPDLTLAVNIDIERAERVGEQKAFIPIDEVVGYIIDQHFPDVAKRTAMHDELRKIRKQLRKHYEATASRVGTVYLVCKNCAAVFDTNQKAAEGWAIEWGPCRITCRTCGQTNIYDGHDFKLRADR